MSRLILVAVLIILLVIIIRHCGSVAETFRPRRVLSDPAHDYNYAYDLPNATEWDVKSWAHIHPCNTSYIYCNHY